MKKTIYISGISIVNLLLIGCIFKVNHWPGANVALTLSLVLLSFWFLPLALINHYKKNKNSANKWVYITAFISFFVVFISALFKIMHWPGASLLLMIGVPIPFLLFMPSFIIYSIKNKEQSFINFTAIVLGLAFIAIYSVLLSVNVSRDILYYGIDLTKSNEKVIDYYEFENAQYGDISNKEIKEIINKSDAICNVIQKAKKELLTYSDNQNISSDLGKEEFRIENLKNLDSKTIGRYVLVRKDGALVPVIENQLRDYKEHLKTLNISTDTKNIINEVVNLDDLVINDENYSWVNREFNSDYFVFALESLSRWEKNVRFIEYIVLSDLNNTCKM